MVAFLYFTAFDILLLAYCYCFSTPPTTKNSKKKSDLNSLSNSLASELNIKVVGFVHKKLLTYFDMLIVPHALHCVDTVQPVFSKHLRENQNVLA